MIMPNTYSFGQCVLPEERFNPCFTIPNWKYSYVQLNNQGNYWSPLDKDARKSQELDETWYSYLVETFGPDHPEAKELKERLDNYYDTRIFAGPCEVLVYGDDVPF